MRFLFTARVVISLSTFRELTTGPTAPRYSITPFKGRIRYEIFLSEYF